MLQKTPEYDLFKSKGDYEGHLWWMTVFVAIELAVVFVTFMALLLACYTWEVAKDISVILHYY